MITAAISGHDRSRAGFTLIEVLVSLVLLSLLVGLLFAGSGALHRSWNATREHDTAGDRDAAALMLADWLAQAVGVVELDPEGILRGSFKGRRDGLDFVTLGQGQGLPAGLVRVSIRVAPPDGGTLVVTRSIFRTGSPQPAALSGDLLRAVTSLRVRYFGRDAPNQAPSWHEEWLDRDSLPLLVSIEIASGTRNEQTSVVTALRLAF